VSGESGQRLTTAPVAGPARTLLVERGQNMKKTLLAPALLLTVGGVQAFGGASDQVGAGRTVAGTVTRLLTRDLLDVTGKEGMIEIVDFAPGEASQVHRHDADLFVYALEGSIVTQVKGGSAQTLQAGGSLPNRRRTYTS
jgi:hypothetical protein